MKLEKGSKVVVIGGGPAGSFFSYYLLKISKERNISLDLNIYEGKIFSKSGPPGCNFCAGVLSETLIEKMKEIGIEIPSEIAQSSIESYCMLTRRGEIILNHPLNLKKILTVFRGNGPLFSVKEENISFDDFLLNEAIKMGAKVHFKKVNSIILPKEEDEKVKVILEDEELEADLVVGSFGLNTEFISKIEKMGFGYKAPKVLKTCQTELELGKDYVKEKFKDSIYILNFGLKDIRFSAIVPKGDFITITLIGKKDLNFQILQNFLKSKYFKEILPHNFSIPEKTCHCFPKIPLKKSKKSYANRFVIIGDASCSRYYKNGIESALITAKYAAETALFYGISKEDFSKHYWKKTKKIEQDNYLGRFLFYLNDLISKFDFIVETNIKIIKSNHFSSKILKDILWNMFTGNIEYKKIFFKLLNPILLFFVGFLTIKNLLKKIKEKL